MARNLILAILLILSSATNAQQTSVHAEQSAYYRSLGPKTEAQYDSINLFSGRLKAEKNKAQLKKRVFGYHPYWMGSSWQNYRWDLLSDLCYFSYDTDPATGNATSTNGFETAEVIDTALAHGVNVHLCVTLFSGHSTFFGNPQAQQTLIGNLISLIIQRGIQGINLDFEAVPASQQQGITDFILQLSAAMHTNVPGAELSIAAPAVNWSNTFNLPAIAPALDLVMIMAYDYYWGGSDIAGPVSGYWPLTSSFNYAVNHSLSYYQSQGIPNEKILLGLPYYGREWPVTSNTLPSSTTGSGTAVTYRNVRSNSSGYYTPNNLYWDYRSYNPYYSYFNNNWHQCFFDDTRSLGAKYDMVNRRNTGGIGIWALGYDNGYADLWNLIADKFTEAQSAPCLDTLYDSGGPWWNYGDSESYTETIQTAWPGPLSLHFEQLNLETGFDSLWIYDGLNTTDALIAALSGNETPPSLTTTGNAFTIRFESDGATARAGYALVWSCPTASVAEPESNKISLFPNPASDAIHIEFNSLQPNTSIRLLSCDGRLIKETAASNQKSVCFDISNIHPGLYLIMVSNPQTRSIRKIMIE
ncbi:MAG: T9SS type A sorting domain-containing protein [Lentimicrobiaceae bacterium]|nr:T9SS type A sorting domain-containing protein [Lentimicrobiaceae bacterium]